MMRASKYQHTTKVSHTTKQTDRLTDITDRHHRQTDRGRETEGERQRVNRRTSWAQTAEMRALDEATAGMMFLSTPWQNWKVIVVLMLYSSARACKEASERASE